MILIVLLYFHVTDLNIFFNLFTDFLQNKYILQTGELYYNK